MKTRRYFAAVPSKEAGKGWPLAFCSGNSNLDDQDLSIETVALKADEVPSVCNDAKPFSELVAGLLNCYFNQIEIKGKPLQEIVQLGKPLQELNIPHPDNTEFPF